MDPRQQKNPQYYEIKLDSIRAEAAPTLDKVDGGDFEWRDVWVLIEQLQQFGDVMDEMINDPPSIIPDDSEQIAERITKA